MNDIFAEHRALVEAGRFDDAMRLSGEALAAAEAALTAAPAEERRALALRFMRVGELQLADLRYADMPEEEAATALMIAATLIIARINPEDIPQAYVQWLQAAVARFGDAVQHSGQEALLPYLGQLMKLAVVTCEDYAARFGLDAATMRTNEAMKSYLVATDMEETDYDGAPIRPQTALDIFVNAINAMATAGLINN